MALSLIKTELHRDSAFGFNCNRCIACCRFKRIQLNPYEIARMARNRSTSTTEFISKYTLNGGTLLQIKEDETCIFLNAEGCAVHSDRPLVCRLYPLGRYVHFLGVETFSQAELEAGCKGVLHENGTIGQYLENQGAFPFMHAADLYLDLLWRLLEMLKDQELESSQSETILKTVRVVSEGGADKNDLLWIDMDRVVADYCKKFGIPAPEGIDERMALHIKAVRQWAA